MKASVKTPSGVKLYYQDEPKRLYKVNGKIVPSVTEVLGVLDKPALVWWGMTIGVQGVAQLLQEMTPTDGGQALIDALDKHEYDWIIQQLTEHQLTVNHVRDKAGVRGNAAHDVLENYAKHGTVEGIDPEDYIESEQGYVQGVLKFIEDAAPEVIASEVMVGSDTHQYAGRYDLLAHQSRAQLVVRNLKRGPKREEFEEGVVLYDLKTTKYVYNTHHLQLAAYEGASRECGYEASDYRAVILVSPDGNYQVTRSPFPCWEQFLAVLGAYKAMQTFKKGK